MKKTKKQYVALILCLVLSSSIFLCGFTLSTPKKDVSKLRALDEEETTINQQIKKYTDETLSEVISIIENGMDINLFFEGSVLEGISLEDLYYYEKQGVSMTSLIAALAENYENADEIMNNHGGENSDFEADNTDDSNSQSFSTSTDAQLYALTPGKGTTVIKSISRISSCSLGTSLTNMGCKSHGRLNKITLKSSLDSADAFCINIGKAAGTGDIYVGYNKKTTTSQFGKIYYWYQTHKNNNAYAASCLMIWAIQAGATIPAVNSGSKYSDFYNKYFSKCISVLGKDTLLNSSTIKKNIEYLVDAINNGPSCTIYYWKNSSSYNQKLITGNMNEKTYNISVKKIGVDKFGSTINSKLSGAVFGIYSSETCSASSLIKKYTTNTNGIFTYSGISKYSNLYIKEITSPKGYQNNSKIYKFNSSDTSLNINNIRKIFGRVGLIKTDSETDIPINDSAKTAETSGRFTLYKDKSCKNIATDIYGNKIYFYTSKNVQNNYWKNICGYADSFNFYSTTNHYIYSGYIPVGTYYLKETKSPKGYELKKDVIAVTVTETGTTCDKAIKIAKDKTKDKPDKAALQLYKNLSDETLEYDCVSGAVYALYAAEEITNKSESKIYKEKEMVKVFPETDNDGFAKLENVTPGKYYIVETKAPIGLYKANETSEKKLEFDQNGNILSDIDENNSKEYGVETIQLKSENSTIDVYDDAILYSLKINKKTKTTEQTKIPLKDAGFQLYSINGISALNEDKNLNLPQNNGKFDYSSFSSDEWSRVEEAAVKLKGNDKMIYTDENGYAESDKTIPYGEYILVERDTPLNENGEAYVYTISPLEISFPSSVTTEDNIYEIELIDEPAFINLKVRKKDINTNEIINRFKTGFRIYNQKTNEYIDNSQNDYLYTEDEGSLTINNLTPGIYVIEEASAPQGYKLNEDSLIFKIVLDNNKLTTWKYDSSKDEFFELEKEGDYFVFDFYDEPLEIQIDKINENGIYVEGATLGLFLADEEGNYIKDVDDNNIMLTGCLINDELMGNAQWITGKTSTKISQIPVGYYYLSEISAPEDHLIAADIFFSVGINEENSNCNNILTGNKEKLTMVDYSCGEIGILKFGEQIVEITEKEDEYGTYYMPEYKNIGLKGVEFTICDDKGQIMDTVITDEKGYAKSKKLPKGTYYIKETEAPNGFIIKENSFDVVADHLIGDITKDNSVAEILNEYQSVNISLKKEGQIIDNNKSIENTTISKFTTVPLSGAVFGIYSAENIMINTTLVLPSSSCLGYIKTDQNGSACLKTKLPEGTYYAKEIKAPEGYAINEEKYYFSLDLDNNNKEISININGNKPIIDNIKKGHIKIIKKEKHSNKLLKDAEFTIYDQKNLSPIKKIVTDDNGFGETDLPLGDYYIVETKAPKDYILDNTKYDVHVTGDDNKELTYNIYNEHKYKLGAHEYWFMLIGILSIVSIIILMFLTFRDSQRKTKDVTHEP